MGRFDTNAQRIARRILRDLVTPERTRAVIELDELYASSDRGAVARVLDQLVTARLVVVQKRAGGGGTAELVHESLIERWPTLRRWVDEDHEDAAFTAQLAAAAKQWDSRGRSNDLLWRGDAADELRRWLVARPRELADRDRAFADAVVALRDRGARRRRRGVIAGFVGLGTVAAGAVVALLQINAAREEALRNAQMADKNAQMADKNAQTADKNAQLWREAASALDAEEREKALAEARRADAERGMADATARARHDKQLAESAVKAKESEVIESREALQAKNQQLESALRDQRAATERAERATLDAQKAQAEAQRAAAEAERTKVELQKSLDKEKKRADALAEERRKLSTTLKE
jgi:hypothetical protein